ncbi:MAG: response regulator [Candidatus Omnitrophica bacterium]|nr:response regulator [Candidatus Omnitrophota bacterium]
MKSPGYVLLVDDEKDFLDTVSFWLESLGHTVRTVSSGKEALRIIAKDRPTIVFLDINMPEMTGFDVLEEIRKTDTKLPVIMLTAVVDQTSIQRAAKLGVAGFFPKDDKLENLSRLMTASMRIAAKARQD